MDKKDLWPMYVQWNIIQSFKKEILTFVTISTGAQTCKLFAERIFPPRDKEAKVFIY